VPEPEGSSRLLSLDVFRGLTIAGMIVVNNPGTWAHVYPPLLHAEWHGWTYTDTIFPFFLYIVGAAMPFSFGRRLTEGAGRRGLLLHTLRRAALIFFLGFGLNWLSVLFFSRQHVRIPGVLQRIAVCFLLAALVYLFLGRRAALPVAGVLLLGYWLAMTRIEVPGSGRGRLDVEGNLAAYVDRLALGEHTWKHDPGWDPEGILSTLPAVSTTLFGVVAGVLLASPASLERKIGNMILVGWIAAGAGLLWNEVFPINKNLWTSSYSVFMAGLAAASLAVCLWAVDYRGWKSWARPFEWLGRNALAAFVLSTFVTILLLAIKIPGPEGKPRSLYSAIYRTLFDHFTDPRLGSLLFAMMCLAAWIAMAGVLYRKRIFIKI
jgi:predicted acyltransferase